LKFRHLLERHGLATAMLDEINALLGERGLILRQGLGAESLVWSLIFLMLPLACVYYPVTTLPHWLQYVALALPPTYVFEGMRAILIDGVFRPDLLMTGLALNLIYLAIGLAAFLALLRSARIHGSLLVSGE
ncbi:MAG TPA: ABC transporter permease, partial [Hyphomicrobiales bacterium]|nr:ABC transporter permease [Hyphomicrobiales bacterium]